MIKVNIYFRVLNNETKQILEALLDSRLPVKIWLPEEGGEYLTRFRIRHIAIINHKNIHNWPECYRWDIGSKSVTLENDGLDHMLANIVDYNNGFICVDSKTHPRNQIVLFHDSIRHNDYPSRFHRIKTFSSYPELKKYVDSLPEQFSLDDNPKFDKTSNIVQGARVYIELSTGHYWYLDNFHKDHYEVFSSDGAHIGEADINGKLDESKKDKSKRVHF